MQGTVKFKKEENPSKTKQLKKKLFRWIEDV